MKTTITLTFIISLLILVFALVGIYTVLGVYGLIALAVLFFAGVYNQYRFYRQLASI